MQNFQQEGASRGDILMCCLEYNSISRRVKPDIYMWLTHHHFGRSPLSITQFCPMFCLKMKEMLVKTFWQAALCRWFLLFPIFAVFPPVFLLSLCFLTSWSQTCAHMVMRQAFMFVLFSWGNGRGGGDAWWMCEGARFNVKPGCGERHVGREGWGVTRGSKCVGGVFITRKFICVYIYIHILPQTVRAARLQN